MWREPLCETEADMDISIGKYVVYRAAEICRVTALEQKNLDGRNTREYWVLSPVGAGRATYYVPADCAQDKLREVLTREQVLELIDGMAGYETPSGGSATDRERKAAQEAVLAEGDHGKVMRMTRALHTEQERRLRSGKKLSAADEKAMKAAEALISREFGFVLGIDESEVAGFIRDRLSRADG